MWDRILGILVVVLKKRKIEGFENVGIEIYVVLEVRKLDDVYINRCDVVV